MSPADGERRLNSAIAPNPGRASASANLTWLLGTRPVPGTGRVRYDHCPEPGSGRGCGGRGSCGHLGLRELHELVEPRRGPARIDRLSRLRDALAQVSGVPRGGDPAGGVEDHRGTVTAVRAREHLAQRRGVRLRVAAAQLRRVAALDAELE